MAVGGVTGDQIDGSNDDVGVGVNVAVAGGRFVDTVDVGPAITGNVAVEVGVVVTVCVDGGPVGVCCLPFCVLVLVVVDVLVCDGVGVLGVCVEIGVLVTVAKIWLYQMVAFPDGLAPTLFRIDITSVVDKYLP